VGEPEQDTGTYFAGMVDELRARQQRGQLAADLDPAYVQLAMFAVALAPQMLPRIARQLTGLDPESPDFVQHYCDQVARIVERLADGR
jgi:hypothetical protein